MEDPKSLEAQLLGDMTYTDPRRQNAPAQPQYQELSEEQIAILQQQRAAAGQPPYTEEEIADLKAEFVNRQRIAAQEAAIAAQAAQQQAAAAALLSEPEDYSAPEKRPQHEALPQVDAGALLEEPAPEAPRAPMFNQEVVETFVHVQSQFLRFVYAVGGNEHAAALADDGQTAQTCQQP